MDEKEEQINILGMPFPTESIVSTNTSNILMSDVLKGNVPMLESDEIELLANQSIMVIMNIHINDEPNVIVGALHSIMSDQGGFELELKAQLSEALQIIMNSNMCKSKINLVVTNFELHKGEKEPIVFQKESEPFTIKGSRLMSIDYINDMCTLMINLL